MLFQQCKSIHILLLWAKFHWKIPLGKWFFRIWPKSKWREIKIGYLAAILKRYNILIFVLQNCDFLLPVHIWCKFQCKILVEKWFSQGGSMEPPLGTNGSKSTLMVVILEMSHLHLATEDSLSDSERPFWDILTFSFSFFKLDHFTDQHLGHETMVDSTN